MVHEVGSGSHWPGRWTELARGPGLGSPAPEVWEQWVDDVALADGVRPLNDLGLRMLRGDRPAQCFWVGEAAPAGLAVLDPADGSAQLVVHPASRRRGIGLALARAVELAHPLSWWSFGTLPGARALASHLGLVPVRELLKMVRDLVAHPPVEVVVSPGVRIDRFTPADVDELVAVNAAAFADHPEQGAMTADDVAVAMTEDWFDPQGILLARSEDTGELLGFHWTKQERGGSEGGRPPSQDSAALPERSPEGDVHRSAQRGGFEGGRPPSQSRGEVYVIGVAPEYEGRGLGRVLLNAGLDHLQRQGVDHVHLFVEAANPRVVRMYESANFEIELRDTSWAAPRPDAPTEDL